MKRLGIIIIIFAIFYPALILASNNHYLKGSPVLIIGFKTQKNGRIKDEQILRNLDLVTNQSFNPATMKSGLLVILQSPKYKYGKEEDVFLYLRLLSAEKEKSVVVNAAGRAKIDIVDLNSGHTMSAIDNELNSPPPLRYGTEIQSIGESTKDIPEIIRVFTLEDFGIASLQVGRYEIRLTYSNEINTYNCWTGSLTANPIEIDIANNALSVSQEAVDEIFEKGYAYAQSGNYDEAISEFSKAIEINPGPVWLYSLYYNRAHVYYSKGDYIQAVGDLNKAIKFNPNDARAYYNRAQAYNDKGNFEQAILDYSKAIELDPNYADAYANRGMVYCIEGNYDKGILDSNKALELNPSDALAYNNRGFAYFYKGDYNKAWDDIHKAESLGYNADPKFLNELKKASGREK